MTRTLPIAGLCILMFASCKKDGAVPAYVQFSTPTVVDANGRDVSSKITDLWVYVNDQPVGVWEPGKRIPMITDGNSNVKLIAGVRKDGLTDARIQYPFYATWQQQVPLVPEQTATLSPVIHYYPNLNYWLVDFEIGQRFDTIQGSTAALELVASDSTLIGQGIQNGRITLDTEHSLYRAVSSDAFSNIGSTAFLEMDYRSDTRLLVGVYYTYAGSETPAPYVYALPTKRADGSMPWNKIYIDLAEAWNVPGALNKRIYLKAELENGATAGTIEMDNIKLVRP